MKVIWTFEAERSFNAILEYLLLFWTQKEVLGFIENVDHTIYSISKQPKMFKISSYDTQSREGFITKHTTMFYRILDDAIEIEYFWGNFQNPDKIKKLLNP